MIRESTAGRRSLMVASPLRPLRGSALLDLMQAPRRPPPWRPPHDPSRDADARAPGEVVEMHVFGVREATAALTGWGEGGEVEWGWGLRWLLVSVRGSGARGAREARELWTEERLLVGGSCGLNRDCWSSWYAEW